VAKRVSSAARTWAEQKKDADNCAPTKSRSSKAEIGNKTNMKVSHPNLFSYEALDLKLFESLLSNRPESQRNVLLLKADG